MEKIHSLTKKLVTTTPKKYWEITMNILFLTVGARNAYYMDSDIDKKFGIGDYSIQSMPKKYRDAILNLCGYMEFVIVPEQGTRFRILNPRKTPYIVPKTDTEVGKQLGFPCSSKAMGIDAKNAVTVNLIIKTEHGDIIVTSFGCFQKERAKYLAWFNSMKPALQTLYWMKLFKKFEPLLNVVIWEKDEAGEVRIADTKEYGMNLNN